MRSVTLLLGSILVIPCLAGTSTQHHSLDTHFSVKSVTDSFTAPINPMFLRKDSMSAHKRSVPSASEPGEDACSSVCGSRVIEGVKDEVEALCSVDGLRATRELLHSDQHGVFVSLTMCERDSQLCELYRCDLVRDDVGGFSHGRVRTDHRIVSRYTSAVRSSLLWKWGPYIGIDAFCI